MMLNWISRTLEPVNLLKDPQKYICRVKPINSQWPLILSLGSIVNNSLTHFLFVSQFQMLHTANLRSEECVLLCVSCVKYI